MGCQTASGYNNVTTQKKCNCIKVIVYTMYYLFSTDVLKMFPNCGYRRMRGFLRARGLEVQWGRIEDSMKRVCPEGVLMRCLQLTVLERRIYKVRSPLSLWHIDGNHKLIRWSSSCFCFPYCIVVYRFLAYFYLTNFNRVYLT